MRSAISSGYSAGNAWVASSNTSQRAPGMAKAISRRRGSGTNSSRAPAMTNVGTRMRGSRSSAQ